MAYHDAALNGDFHNLCGRKFATFPGMILLCVKAAFITSLQKVNFSKICVAVYDLLLTFQPMGQSCLTDHET